MKESIIIQNFGGLKNVTFELDRINIFIGPQASGKSVTAKLLFFFKKFPAEILNSIENKESKRDLDSRQKKKFGTYFPKESWSKSDFKIEYRIGDSYIVVSKVAQKPINFNYSDDFKKLLDKGRKIYKDEQKKSSSELRYISYKISRNTRNRFYECLKNDISVMANYSQFFVPAGRSFFANIQSSIFSFLSNNKFLDPFLIEFGSFYEEFKRFAYSKTLKDGQPQKTDKAFDKLINEIVSGNFIREKEKDFIIHNDNRKVNLANASSGQQEILPLVLVLRTLNNLSFSSSGATLYIEEPEAHLFPTAQKKIVQLLARTFNNKNNNFQLIITTHSPYILSSFNNLIEAGKIVDENKDKLSKVDKVIPNLERLTPQSVKAYSVYNGKKQSLMDKENKLISSNILDSVSDEIAIDFGKLLDIEF